MSQETQEPLWPADDAEAEEQMRFLTERAVKRMEADHGDESE